MNQVDNVIPQPKGSLRFHDPPEPEPASLSLLSFLRFLLSLCVYFTKLSPWSISNLTHHRQFFEPSCTYTWVKGANCETGPDCETATLA